MRQVVSVRVPKTNRAEALRFQLVAAEYLERLGERIRERREELRLTREEVARAMPGKTSGNQVYRWEKGLHQPGPENLQALAGVLRVEVSYFLVAAPAAGTPDLMGALADDEMIRDIRAGMTLLLKQQAEILARLPPEASPPPADTSPEEDDPPKAA